MDICRQMVLRVLGNGQALERLAVMVEAQGGDSRMIRNPQLLEKAPLIYPVRAPRSGYITHMDTENCGIASAMLGAGRETKDSRIDYSAGIVLERKTGDFVEKGQVLAQFYASDEKLFAAAEERFLHAVVIGNEKPERQPLIYARVTKDGVLNDYKTAGKE